MSDAANRIVQKLWSYCNVLRDDGLSYQDYLEQLTFLLFLKMADERAAAHRRAAADPGGLSLGRPRGAADGGRRAGSSTTAKRFGRWGKRAGCSA